MNRYNAEGYIDLTAYEALSRIEREERKAKKAAAYRPLVYICSPYTSVLPIPTAASMTISKTPDDTAALQ